MSPTSETWTISTVDHNAYRAGRRKSIRKEGNQERWIEKEIDDGKKETRSVNRKEILLEVKNTKVLDVESGWGQGGKAGNAADADGSEVMKERPPYDRGRVHKTNKMQSGTQDVSVEYPWPRGAAGC
ncbi:hypothetical protein L6452_38634 [Arctium lappa]|uniref:Uncharacterized protein n=1 Tax=Arctium lappa TaxID=4217 RepID=A0ACB8XR86_ARCLA|nr:hypothetical protein L6452_38634 [Arctium lappa]